MATGRYRNLLLLRIIILLLAGTGTLIAQDPAKVARTFFSVKLENERTRVLELTIPPGQKTPMHYHPDHTFYAQTKGSLKIFYLDRTTEAREMQAGESLWVGAMSYALENKGKTEFRALIVEFKEQAKLHQME